MTASTGPAHTQSVRYGQIDLPYLETLRAVPAAQDGPLLMLNLMRYRDVADYQDGRDEPPISGREADDRYAPLEILTELGAEVVLFGDVIEQPRGDEQWERAAVVRYPSARVFLEMNERPDFIDRHVHKDAGMARTIISLCRGSQPSLAGATAVLIDLVVTSTSPDGALRVEGSPVGDGRPWTAVRLSPAHDEPLALVDGVEAATTVLVRPLVNAL